MIHMFFRRRYSVSDLAALHGDSSTPSQASHPFRTASLWAVAIAAPTYGLHAMGDVVASGAWFIVASLACLGSYMGLVRTAIWMAITPVCTAAAAFGGPHLVPHLTFIPPNLNSSKPYIAMAIIGLTTLIAIVYLINRPVYRFVDARPRLATWNSIFGSLLTGTKGAALVVTLIALILYAEKNQSSNNQLAALTEVIGIDFDQSIVQLADKVRGSQLGTAVVKYIPQEEIIRKLRLESFEKYIPENLGGLASLMQLQSGSVDGHLSDWDGQGGAFSSTLSQALENHSLGNSTLGQNSPGNR